MFSIKKPGVLYTEKAGFVYDTGARDFLYSLIIRDNLTIGRICLHHSEESELMSMIVMVIGRYVYPPHRHAWKDEVYTVLEGSARFCTYDEEGVNKEKLLLCQGDSYYLMALNKSLKAAYNPQLSFDTTLSGTLASLSSQAR